MKVFLIEAKHIIQGLCENNSGDSDYFFVTKKWIKKLKKVNMNNSQEVRETAIDFDQVIHKNYLVIKGKDIYKSNLNRKMVPYSQIKIYPKSFKPKEIEKIAKKIKTKNYFSKEEVSLYDLLQEKFSCCSEPFKLKKELKISHNDNYVGKIKIPHKVGEKIKEYFNS